jgi:hypothetical protein
VNGPRQVESSVRDGAACGGRRRRRDRSALGIGDRPEDGTSSSSSCATRSPATHQPTTAHGLGGPGRLRRPHPAATPSTALPASGHTEHGPVLASPPRAQKVDRSESAGRPRATTPSSLSWSRWRGRTRPGVSENPGRVAQTRRGVGRCGDRGCHETAAMSEGELHRRARCADQPSQTHRPHVDLRGRQARKVLAEYSAHCNTTATSSAAAASAASGLPDRRARLRGHLAATGPRRPGQRVRARSLNRSVRGYGRVLEPHAPLRGMTMRCAETILWCCSRRRRHSRALTPRSVHVPQSRQGE